MSATQEDKILKEFCEWFACAKYTQVIFQNDFNKQIAWDAWQAASATANAKLSDAQRRLAAYELATDWQPLTEAGQIQEGDKITFTLCNEQMYAIARAVLNAGTDNEEVVYNRKENHYFITLMALDGSSSHKNVRFKGFRKPADTKHLEAVIKQATKLLEAELSAANKAIEDFAVVIAKQNQQLSEQQAILDGLHKAFHYPECWDTAAYPSLNDAAHEVFCCSECPQPKPALPAVPEGMMMVEIDLMQNVSKSLGSFCGDEGWTQHDMDVMDAVDAILASAPQPHKEE